MLYLLVLTQNTTKSKTLKIFDYDKNRKGISSTYNAN